MFVLQAYIITESYRLLTPIYRHAKDKKKLESVRKYIHQCCKKKTIRKNKIENHVYIIRK